MQSETNEPSLKKFDDQYVPEPPESFYFTDLEESLIMDTKIDHEKFCQRCTYVLVKCLIVEGMYCEKCDIFYCFRCKKEFSKKSVCGCNKCTCCFTELCVANEKIGQNCQTMCSLCYEENEPTSYNLLKYSCGHKICRICVFQHTISEKLDPRSCFICRD